MIWLYPVGESFTIFYEKPELEGLIEVDSIPEGSGILKMDSDGKLYRVPYPTLPPEVIPPKPQTSLEKMEKTIMDLYKRIEFQNEQSMAILDVNMTIYEEILLMQEGTNV